MLAGKEFGIPLYGTMAHSFIQAHDDEAAAFEDFARSRPHDLTLLIDTYDTEEGARKVVAVARRLRDAGIAVGGVRLDSGDLIALSKSVRRILDDGGLNGVKIFASGGIDDEELVAFVEANAPIDGFGIGTSLTTSYDLPALDCAYKLQEYAGTPRRKRSAGKATWPGRKQVWRRYAPDGRMAGDTISLDGDDEPGAPLIMPVMCNGKRLGPRPGLDEIRARAARDLARLPEPLSRLKPDADYPVEIAQSVRRLASEVDRRLHQGEGASP
jgi:nicotinate phosphoribosyltransferase